MVASTVNVAGTSKSAISLWIAAFATVALTVLSLFVGVYDLSGGERGWDMFWISRVPRTVALVLAGSAMAVAGLLMQMITQNRFAEPTTTGTAEWSAFGLLLTVLVFPTASLGVKMVAAAAMALLGTILFLLILQRVVLKSSLIVPLIGIMLGAVVSAVTTFIAASTNTLQMLGTWFQGSFTSVVRGRYEVLWIVALVVVGVYVAADRFTVAGLGSELATAVGLNYRRTVFVGASLVAIATGVTTVVVGFLPFLGLVVPNLVSLWRGDNLRANLPWVCIGGITLVIICDIIGRTIRMPFEIPVSLILGIFGAAVFVYLLLKGAARG